MQGREADPLTFRYKVALGGASGSGKSTGLTTLPGRKLFIDTDGRAESLFGFADTEAITIVETDKSRASAWYELLNLRDELTALARSPKEFPYDSIILDGLTSMNRFALNWALLLDQSYGLGGSPAQQHYNPQMHELMNFIFQILALPCHIGISFHPEMYEDKAAGTLRWVPKMYGKTRNEFPNWFNETYFCERVRPPASKNGASTLQYRWITSGTASKDLYKSAMNRLGKHWNDPVVIDFDQELTGFEYLFHKRFGMTTEQAREAREKEAPIDKDESPKT